MSYLISDTGKKYKLGTAKIVFPNWGVPSQSITTEDGFDIITEDGQTIITE